MAVNPTRDWFVTGSGTWAEARSQWDLIIAAILDAAGSSPAASVALTAAGEAVVTRGFVALTGYEDAGTGTMLRASLDLPEGMAIVLVPQAGKVITVDHGAAGDGGIDLHTGTAVVLSAVTTQLTLKRVGTRWRELRPHSGDFQIPAGSVGEDELGDGSVTTAKRAPSTPNSVAAYGDGEETGAPITLTFAALAAALVGHLGGEIGAPTPGIVSTNADPFVLSGTNSAAQNKTLVTHQANVAVHVPADAAAGEWWLLNPRHAGAVVAVVGDAGSVNGVGASATPQLVAGRYYPIFVESNAGSAPAVRVHGVPLPPDSVSSTRSYTNADHDRDFRLVGGAGNQTMPTAAAVAEGTWFHIFNQSGATRDLVGADATHALANNEIALIWRLGPSLMAFGSSGITVLDAA